MKVQVNISDDVGKMLEDMSEALGKPKDQIVEDALLLLGSNLKQVTELVDARITRLARRAKEMQRNK